MHATTSYFNGGLGAYPEQPWYDPERPSLLPYWIDTWGEYQNKPSGESLFGGVAESVGGAFGSVLGKSAEGFTSGVVNAADSGSGLNVGTLAIYGLIAFLLLRK